MAFGLDLGNLIVHLRADDAQFNRTLLNAENRLRRTADKFSRIGRSMTMYVTAPIVAMGVAATKSFASFDDAMTQSLAIMKDATPDMRREMESLARDISKESITSATDLAKSYFYLASAGFSAEQSIASLAAVEKFAVAGRFDMALATDLATDAQSALGLTVKDAQKNLENMTRVTDVLTGANTLANATVQQFSESLVRAGPAMKAFGIEIEEGTAVLSAFADQGKKGAMSGELFSRMLRLMIKGFIDSRAAWDRFGISIEDADGSLRPIADIVRDLTSLLDDMGVVQKAATLQMLGFQARSQQAIMPLLGMGDAIEKYNELLIKMRGITEEIAEKQLKSFSSQMRIMWHNVTDVARDIGGLLAPHIIKLNKYITKATDFWHTLNDSVKQNILFYAGLVAAIGPLLIATGLLIKSLALVIGTVKVLVGLLGGLAAAIATPLIVIVALAAIAYVLRAAWVQNLAAIKDRMKDFVDSAKYYFDFLANSVIGKFVIWMYDTFKQAFTTIAKGWKEFIADIVALTAGAMAALRPGGKTFAQAYVDAFDSVMAKMTKFEKVAVRTFKAGEVAVRALGEATVEHLEDLMDAVKTQFGEDADAIVALIRSKIQQLQKMPISPHEQLRLLMERPEAELERLKKEMDDIKNAMEDVNEPIEEAGHKIEEYFATWVGAAADTFTNIKNIISSTLESASEALTDLSIKGRADFNALARSILRDMTQMIIRAQMARAIMAFFPTLAPTALVAPQPVYQVESPIGHGGGTIGQLQASRYVDASVFDDAQRRHQGGLASDEVPIIAQAGEELLSKEDVASRDEGSRREKTVNINVYAIDAQGTYQFLNKNKRAIATMLQGVRDDNHPSRKPGR